ncbi:hypothetical protein E8E13_010814 [Curvularia kusanoi]|uniref:Uncharacterized protein n=1 Tax=Curvularia kusanoi TaxID=90978 RepID=A0A9P4TL23_CURKU|nr:hypothetical protein E8E13_010814 [Curvularia kusanoi]
MGMADLSVRTAATQPRIPCGNDSQNFEGYYYRDLEDFCNANPDLWDSKDEDDDGDVVKCSSEIRGGEVLLQQRLFKISAQETLQEALQAYRRRLVNNSEEYDDKEEEDPNESDRYREPDDDEDDEEKKIAEDGLMYRYIPVSDILTFSAET